MRTDKPGPIASPEADPTNATTFKRRLRARCNVCQYEGVMGWNRQGVTGGIIALQIVSIPVTLIALLLLFQVLAIGLLMFVPAIILGFAFRRYHAQCPRCRQRLLLKGSEASDVV